MLRRVRSRSRERPSGFQVSRFCFHIYLTPSGFPGVNRIVFPSYGNRALPKLGMDFLGLRPTMSSKGTALVTGAAQGIGRSIALRLADDGFDVAVNDVSNNSEKLDALVDEIQGKGRASSKYIADVSQDEQVRAMISEVAEKHGSLDVMVANAGVAGLMVPFGEVSVEDWDRVMNVNSRGVFLCYKYAGNQMVKQGRGGRIIGASSFVGQQGIGPAPYSASKFAVRGLTQAAARDFGAHGITVNCYAPGVIDTPMLGAVARDAIVDQFTKFEPEDIAGLVSYLVSKEAKFITG
ncbi:hypothetical protein B0H14DRAFT_2762926, partial [Mycena olivaceomarginata]